MPDSSSPSTPEQITLARLSDSLRWYGDKSSLNKRWFQTLKFVTILSAALIPFVSTNKEIPSGSNIAALLGVLIAVIEGVQQLKQYHVTWVSYRATAESLKREQYLYLAKAGPYRTAEAPAALLAERVEALVSSEEDKWASLQTSTGGGAGNQR